VTPRGKFLVGYFASVDAINDQGRPIELADLESRLASSLHQPGLYDCAPLKSHQRARRGPGRARSEGGPWAHDVHRLEGVAMADEATHRSGKGSDVGRYLVPNLVILEGGATAALAAAIGILVATFVSKDVTIPISGELTTSGTAFSSSCSSSAFSASSSERARRRWIGC
jgi:hypothetical protein